MPLIVPARPEARLLFETAELGNKVAKAIYKKQAPKLRARLLEAQRQLAASDVSVCLRVGGVKGAGKLETVNLLLEWMDARGIETHAMSDPTDEERERPEPWRFWRLLPKTGRPGIEKTRVRGRAVGRRRGERQELGARKGRQDGRRDARAGAVTCC